MTALLSNMGLRVSVMILCNSLHYFMCSDEDTRCIHVIHGGHTSAGWH